MVIRLPSLQKNGNILTQSSRYLPEFAHPYYKFEGKADVVIASPKGGEAPLDPSSVEAFKEDAECTKFLKEKESLWKNTENLSDYSGKADQFDAIFFVGGHGRKSPVPFSSSLLH